MKFLLDSCISGYAARDVRNAGFDVLWIPEVGKDPGDEEGFCCGKDRKIR